MSKKKTALSLVEKESPGILFPFHDAKTGEIDYMWGKGIVYPKSAKFTCIGGSQMDLPLDLCSYFVNGSLTERQLAVQDLRDIITESAKQSKLLSHLTCVTTDLGQPLMKLNVSGTKGSMRHDLDGIIIDRAFSSYRGITGLLTEEAFSYLAKDVSTFCACAENVQEREKDANIKEALALLGQKKSARGDKEELSEYLQNVVPLLKKMIAFNSKDSNDEDKCFKKKKEANDELSLYMKNIQKRVHQKTREYKIVADYASPFKDNTTEMRIRESTVDVNILDGMQIISVFVGNKPFKIVDLAEMGRVVQIVTPHPEGAKRRRTMP